MSGRETTGFGVLHFKVALAPVAWPAGTSGYTGELFVSMPFPGADPDWIAKVVAYIREGFGSGEIETGNLRVTIGQPQRAYPHYADEVGAALTTISARLKLAPR